ncbi:hypothetical protein BpHYR1_004410 [Brachionus plicatilis]|uniref:Uncharacterized protein n=1 Tax=Brachionus plicatilis TaxID=10195 RepID=A0A3M7QY69_BRAPC|nr:hypothetical protein BpHYR1_004410 [Brachionus plicatilis]
MSLTTTQGKDKAFTIFFSELESISISSSDMFSKNVTRYLELNDTFSIQQNLLILKHFESKCSVAVLIYRKNKDSINAKFKFVKVILSILYIIQATEYGKFFTQNFNKLENILNVLMLFTVIRSLQQLNLFKLNYDDDYKILNNEMFKDEINLIELMNEFRNSIFYLARKFRRLFRKNLLSKSTENNLIYEYTTWLMSIWIDTTLEIKNKLKLLDESQFVNSLRINSKECKIMLRLELLFNEDNISNTIISRIPFYLDSIVFYICDFVLLMENLNSSFIDYLIPLLRYFLPFYTNVSVILE